MPDYNEKGALEVGEQVEEAVRESPKTIPPVNI